MTHQRNTCSDSGQLPFFPDAVQEYVVSPCHSGKESLAGLCCVTGLCACNLDKSASVMAC